VPRKVGGDLHADRPQSRQFADIAAEFRIAPEIAAWLADNDLASEDDALLVRRTVDAGGRSKAFINGTPATLAQLRALGERLVDVHGQHAHQSLLKPSAQLALLDEHGGHTQLAREVAAAFAAHRAAVKAREDAETMAASAAAEQDRLRWIVEELGEIAPADGEWEQVESEHKRLAHAANLLEGAQAAVDALSEAEDSALTRIDTVAARLGQLAQYDARLQTVLGALEAARIQVDEAVSELHRYLAKTELDGARLADVEARVSALHSAARKFKCAPGALPALLKTSREKLAALSAASDLDALRRREAETLTAYMAVARKLSGSPCCEPVPPGSGMPQRRSPRRAPSTARPVLWQEKAPFL